MVYCAILAQQSPGSGSFVPSLDTIFWASVLLIFGITIVSAWLRRLSKDKTLKLFNDYHVTFYSEKRSSLWGDLAVFSQGVEIIFDQPYTTHRTLTKSAALLYEDEFAAMIGLTRSVHGLTDAERRHRTAQIQRTFKPNVFRRFQRGCRNFLNTMRDAISKTVNLVIGRFTAGTAGIGGLGAGVISTQAGDINALTGAVVGLAANAYEPLLERHIGRPVVVEINLPPAADGAAGANPVVAEFPGYLVDYTQKFMAIFNVEHTPVETVSITLEPGKAADPDLADLKFTFTSERTVLACSGKDAFVLRHLSRKADGAETSDLGIAMIPGTNVILSPVREAMVLTVERTRQIDLIVPRSRARVRFAAGGKRRTRRRREWLGISPLLEPKEFFHSIRENIGLLHEAPRENPADQGGDEPPKSGPRD